MGEGWCNFPVVIVACVYRKVSVDSGASRMFRQSSPMNIPMQITMIFHDIPIFAYICMNSYCNPKIFPWIPMKSPYFPMAFLGARPPGDQRGTAAASRGCGTRSHRGGGEEEGAVNNGDSVNDWNYSYPLVI
jgi:hypothetical protein